MPNRKKWNSPSSEANNFSDYNIDQNLKEGIAAYVRASDELHLMEEELANFAETVEALINEEAGIDGQGQIFIDMDEPVKQLEGHLAEIESQRLSAIKEYEKMMGIAQEGNKFEELNELAELLEAENQDFDRKKAFLEDVIKEFKATHKEMARIQSEIDKHYAPILENNGINLPKNPFEFEKFAADFRDWESEYDSGVDSLGRDTFGSTHPSLDYSQSTSQGVNTTEFSELLGESVTDYEELDEEAIDRAQSDYASLELGPSEVQELTAFLNERQNMVQKLKQMDILAETIGENLKQLHQEHDVGMQDKMPEVPSLSGGSLKQLEEYYKNILIERGQSEEIFAEMQRDAKPERLEGIKALSSSTAEKFQVQKDYLELAIGEFRDISKEVAASEKQLEQMKPDFISMPQSEEEFVALTNILSIDEGKSEEVEKLTQQYEAAMFAKEAAERAAENSDIYNKQAAADARREKFNQQKAAAIKERNRAQKDRAEAARKKREDAKTKEQERKASLAERKRGSVEKPKSNKKKHGVKAVAHGVVGRKAELERERLEKLEAQKKKSADKAKRAAERRKAESERKRLEIEANKKKSAERAKKAAENRKRIEMQKNEKIRAGKSARPKKTKTPNALTSTGSEAFTPQNEIPRDLNPALAAGVQKARDETEKYTKPPVPDGFKPRDKLSRTPPKKAPTTRRNPETFG